MTAVKWMHDKWSNCKEWKWEQIEQWFEQAKEMEKNQIIGAYQKGRFNYEDWNKGIKKNLVQSEQYYNETYGSKGSDDYKKIRFTEEEWSVLNNGTSQTEISDEEIEKEALSYFNEHHCNVFEYDAFIAGVKWYREQLKKKQ